MKKLFSLSIVLMLAFTASSVLAEELSVYTAANFTLPMKELAKRYEEQTGVKIVPNFGSTGMLYGQIENGAPVDLFFAADEKRPEMLFKAGKSLQPVTYAKGRAVLWTLKDITAETWQEALQALPDGPLGLSNPKTAPYGATAKATLEDAGLWEKLEARIVYGKSVSQVFQFAHSDAAVASFCALSQTLSEEGAKGHHWIMTEAAPVSQGACVLKGEKQESAAKFLEFVLSDANKELLGSFGYE